MSSVSQAPPTLNVSFVRGDDLSLNVALTDADAVPINITGWTLAAQVRLTATTTTTLAEWAVGNRDDANGTFTLSLTDEQTATLPETCVSDLQGADAGGLVRTYLSMKLAVIRDVTR